MFNCPSEDYKFSNTCCRQKNKHLCLKTDPNECNSLHVDRAFGAVFANTTPLGNFARPTARHTHRHARTHAVCRHQVGHSLAGPRRPVYDEHVPDDAGVHRVGVAEVHEGAVSVPQVQVRRAHLGRDDVVVVVSAGEETRAARVHRNTCWRSESNWSSTRGGLGSCETCPLRARPNGMSVCSCETL